MMTNQPLDVLLLRDSEAGYEAIGLQYYQVLEWERDVESFNHFGTPIRITEMGFSCSSAPFSGAGEICLSGQRQTGRGYDLA